MLARLHNQSFAGEEAQLLNLDTGRVDFKNMLSERDRACLQCFDELNAAVLNYGSAILQAERDLELSVLKPREILLQVRLAHERFLAHLKGLAQQILTHQSEQLQANYELRKQVQEFAGSVTHLDHTLRQVQGSKAYRFSETLRGSYHRAAEMLERLRSALNSKNGHDQLTEATASEEAPPAREISDGISGITDEHQFFAVENPYSKVDNRGTSFEIFRNWVTVFHFGERMYGSQQPLVNDWIPNLTELNKLFPLSEKRILELGSLEGGNTKQLLDLGAREVVGIESNSASFLKSLITKNEFGLNGARFLYGDCNVIMGREEFRRQGKYDLCYASGILYHMEEPLRTIELLTGSADTIYIWSQVATERLPAGEWVSLSDDSGRVYSGRINEYRESSHIGGVGRYAVWLTRESLLQAFRDRGFSIDELGGRQTFKGDSAEFLARRNC